MNRSGYGNTANEHSQFKDSTNRGSQTEPLSAQSWRELQAACNPTPAKAFAPTQGRRLPPTPQSRIALSPLIPKSNNPPAKRKKYSFPHSNSHTEGPPGQTGAQDFSLHHFVYGPDPTLNFHHDELNDDLSIEHYRSAPLSYLGSQRRGIVDPLPTTSSYEEHIKGALNAAFPLHEPAPLPVDLEWALRFQCENDLATIQAYRSTQLAWVRKIAAECQHTTDELYRSTPSSIAPATGKVHIALLSHLMGFTQMKGRKWVTQFVTGFPMTGCLSQSGVFPLDPETPTTFTDPTTLFATSAERFATRSKRSVSRHTAALWEEAMAQVRDGWLSEPQPLNADGRFAARPEEECNIAFRFGVEQADKLRGCDDLRDSLTNTACTIRTPITLPGWDHIASACRYLRTTQCEWSFGKVDHRAAYKALPLREEDARYAIIALWAPTEKLWVGCRSRTQLFGSIASVLHYNCLSRIIASLICRILLIPTLGYFDDFGFFARTAEEAVAMRDVTEFLDLFGIELKTAKSVIGLSNIFLGLTAFFPRPANGMALVISLPREKAHRWARLINTIIASANISHSTLESLIGRLSFSQTAVFGRFARAMLKPLYAKLFSPRFHPQLSLPLIRNLQWWATILLSLTPRVATLTRSSPDWVVYTDAAYDEGPEGAHTAAVFLNTDGPFVLQASLVLTASPPAEDIAFFQATSTIFGLELSAVVLAFFAARNRLQGKSVTCYIDNNAALAAIIKGDSSSTAASKLIATLWFIISTYDIAVWFNRVETARNIADLPTRNKPLPFPVAENSAFPPLSEVIEFYNQRIAIHHTTISQEFLEPNSTDSIEFE